MGVLLLASIQNVRVTNKTQNRDLNLLATLELKGKRPMIDKVLEARYRRTRRQIAEIAAEQWRKENLIYCPVLVDHNTL